MPEAVHSGRREDTVAEGSPLGLKKEIGADAITITVQNKAGAADKAPPKAAARELLSKLPAVIDIVDAEEGLTIYVKNGGLFVPELVRTFDKTDIDLVLDRHLHPQPGRRLPEAHGQEDQGEGLVKRSPRVGSGAGEVESHDPSSTRGISS